MSTTHNPSRLIADDAIALMIASAYMGRIWISPLQAATIAAQCRGLADSPEIAAKYDAAKAKGTAGRIDIEDVTAAIRTVVAEALAAERKSETALALTVLEAGKKR